MDDPASSGQPTPACSGSAAGPETGQRLPAGRGRLALPGVRRFLAAGVVLTLCFGGSLIAWASYVWGESLHSHALLIPGVVGYMIHLRRDQLPHACHGSPVGAAVFLVAGAGLLALALVPSAFAQSLSVNDSIAARVGAWLCLLGAAAFTFLGRRWMRAVAFPALVAGFMIPLPDAAVAAFEAGLMRASADAAHWLFQITGTPVFRDGQILEVPGITMEVARECSGIRSTWVLLITSLLASWVFLRSPWRRAVLVACVIPLGILRNALRIVVIGMLCMSQGPHMIDSWIHRRGGPVFFAASLVPLLALAWWLRWNEAGGRRRAKNRSDVSADRGQNDPARQASNEP